jgi:ferritin
MSLSARLQEAINNQINSEYYSAYLYLSMAAYCESINLLGFSHWMRVQHQEELSHALKLFDFVNDRGGRVMLKGVEQPPAQFTSPLELMEKTLEHEQHVTSLINRLYELSVEESDYPTQVLMQWFIREQVEEEKMATEIIDQLKLVGGEGTGLLMIDTRMGQRISGQASGE